MAGDEIVELGDEGGGCRLGAEAGEGVVGVRGEDVRDGGRVAGEFGEGPDLFVDGLRRVVAALRQFEDGEFDVGGLHVAGEECGETEVGDEEMDEAGERLVQPVEPGLGGGAQVGGAVEGVEIGARLLDARLAVVLPEPEGAAVLLTNGDVAGSDGGHRRVVGRRHADVEVGADQQHAVEHGRRHHVDLRPGTIRARPGGLPHRDLHRRHGVRPVGAVAHPLELLVAVGNPLEGDDGAVGAGDLVACGGGHGCRSNRLSQAHGRLARSVNLRQCVNLR